MTGDIRVDNKIITLISEGLEVWIVGTPEAKFNELEGEFFVLCTTQGTTTLVANREGGLWELGGVSGWRGYAEAEYVKHVLTTATLTASSYEELKQQVEEGQTV